MRKCPIILLVNLELDLHQGRSMSKNQLATTSKIILGAIIIIALLIAALIFWQFYSGNALDSSENTSSSSVEETSTTSTTAQVTTSTEVPTTTTTTVEDTTTEETTVEETTTTTTTVPTTQAPTTQTPTSQAATPTPTTTVELVSPDGRRGSQLDTAFTVNGIEVVNKQHWVNSNYRPLPDYMQNNGLREEAWTAFLNMQAAAAEEGVTLVHISSYRTYELQARLFANYSLRAGEEAANRYSARAGQSEHQTGLAIDITSGGDLYQSFADTPGGIWLWEHAYEYGFILRYPQGKEHITGYMFEPWHFRYVGVDVAADFGPNHTLTLEEYLGIVP